MNFISSEPRQIFIKSLPGANRKKDEPVELNLSADERETLGDYFEVKGQPMAAKHFREAAEKKKNELSNMQ